MRAVPATCAHTAATAVKTRPDPAIASASAMDPAAGSPSRVSPAVISTARPMLAPAAISSAAVSGAFLPTTAEPTSSSLPVSSSALVCLTTMKMLMSPAPRAANPP